MSCPHGNHPDNCDICDEVAAAYNSGVEHTKLAELEAQPEQEPILYGVMFSDGKASPYAHWSKKDAERIAAVSAVGCFAAPLYASPPQRIWVGLTDDEIKAIVGPWGSTEIKGYTRTLFDQIEAALKEKNT